MKALHVVGGVVATAVVVVVIVVPCVLLLPTTSDPAPADLPPVEFEDLYTSKFSYKSLYPNWDYSTAVKTDFLTLDDGAVKRRDINDYTSDVETVAPDTLYKQYDCNGYSVSADALFVFYRYNYNKVWRHSYTADFAIWDVAKKQEVNIPYFPKDGKIHHMEWSPTGHRLAYVHNFVVKMIDDVGAGNPKIIDVSPIDGEENMQYYGIPDWMYEEEMISSNNVLYWSPDSSRIAFLSTNEKDVELIEYTWYGDKQYPQTIKIAYPKAGTAIGNVVMWAYDINTGRLAEMEAPFIGDFYFSRFTWNNNSTALVTWTNRIQTESRAQLCKETTETSFEFTCSSSDANKEIVVGGWVGSFGPFYPVWKTGTDDYYTIYAKQSSENPDNGYWQLALVEENSPTFTWMTNTNYDIVSVNYYDSSSGHIYFTAAHDEARRRQILRVKATDKNRNDPECMTCNLMTSFPDRCGWISPVFGDGNVVLNCRGPLIPLTITYGINKEGNWENMRVIENNEELTATIAETKWPVREYGKFQSSEYPEKPYNYEIFRPADFDENKKYPLLIEVYAGPEFQKVVERFTRGFAQAYMVSKRDVIVASVDGRGSAFEGYKFMREAYLKLGHNEKIDQTDFAKHLISEYNYIDPDHVALWGWSYGGYTTSHVIGYDGGETFQCGVAVAPLADWEWYDAMYAERYMQKPDDNRDNYIKSSIITGNDLANFKNAWYVLIHGTADDNVHFQSAAQMEKALVAADVDFDDFFYADEAHSVNTGKNANQHIYHQLDMRLSHCLGRVESPYPG